jgi:tetratricopeptide (TPR) repeat protein
MRSPTQVPKESPGMTATSEPPTPPAPPRRAFVEAVLEEAGSCTPVRVAFEPVDAQTVQWCLSPFEGPGAPRTLYARRSELTVLPDRLFAAGQAWTLRHDPVVVGACLRLVAPPMAREQRALCWRLLCTLEEQTEAQLRAEAAEPGRREALLEAARALFRQGRILCHSHGQGDIAVWLLRAALRVRHALLGDAMDVAVTCNDLGLAMRQLGRYERAVTYFQEAHDYFERHHGEQHPDYVTTLHNIGANQRHIGQAEAGERALRRAYDLHRKHAKTDLIDRSNTCWLLAEAIVERLEPAGPYDEAIKFYREAIELRRRKGRAVSKDSATLWLALGRTLRSAGALGAAQDALRSACAGYEKACGPGHASTREAHEELAALERRADGAAGGAAPPDGPG